MTVLKLHFFSPLSNFMNLTLKSKDVCVGRGSKVLKNRLRLKSQRGLCFDASVYLIYDPEKSTSLSDPAVLHEKIEMIFILELLDPTVLFRGSMTWV